MNANRSRRDMLKTLGVGTAALGVPELTAGRHEIELEIIKIRQKDESNARGYWRVSAVIVADEPWPVAEQGGDPPPNQP